MGTGQKVLTTVLWALLVCAMLGVVGYGMWGERSSTGAISPLHDGATTLFPAPEFSLIDQNFQTITDQTLRGSPWIAAFIFTNCAGPCPMMSAKMAQLQESVPEKSVKLVSFTVDPERDTPEVLKKYAENFKADESRWHFLTGEKQAIFNVAAGMKVAAQPGTSENEIIHSTRFMLVDQNGNVRGIYSMDDADEMNQLAASASKLAKDGPEARLP